MKPGKQEQFHKTTPFWRFVLYAVLSCYALLVIYPMVWLVLTSLKDSWSIFKNPWAIPETLKFVNYPNAWIKGALGLKFLNSLVIDSLSLLFILCLSSMAAYVLARFRFWGNRFIYYLFLSGMILPVFLGIVPLFILMQKMKLLNTRIGLGVIYVSYSLSFTIFILCGFFKTLPKELAEAAVIDGCSPFALFWKVMLPLAKPGLVTAGIFVFIGLWNEYPLALVLISSDKLQTLPLGLANLTMTLKYQSDWGALFAGLVIAVLPTVILYILFQKQIQAGLTAGAIKG